jgi:hypothetical protein
MVPGMDSLKPPGTLKLTGNLDANWKTFKQQFELYLTTIGVSETSNKRKIALLLPVAGTEAIEVYNTFTFDPEEDKNKLDAVLKQFDERCLAKKNETYKRYVFRSRLHREGEALTASSWTECNETDDSDSQSDPEFVYMVTEGGSEIEETGQPVKADETVRPVNAVQTDKWVAPLLVNGTVVLFRLDTGAKANLISLKDIKALKEKPKIQ